MVLRAKRYTTNLAILATLDTGPQTFGDLRRATHARPETLEAALRRLVKVGLVAFTGDDGARVYALSWRTPTVQEALARREKLVAPARVAPAKPQPQPQATATPPRRSLGLVAGPGDRHDDCASYRACLGAFRGVGDAHCPTACSGYATADRRAERDRYAAARTEAA